jgi:hypothetical protein
VRDVEVDDRLRARRQLDVVFRGRQIRGPEVSSGKLSGSIRGQTEAATGAVR